VLLARNQHLVIDGRRRARSLMGAAGGVAVGPRVKRALHARTDGARSRDESVGRRRCRGPGTFRHRRGVRSVAWLSGARTNRPHSAEDFRVRRSRDDHPRAEVETPRQPCAGRAARRAEDFLEHEDGAGDVRGAVRSPGVVEVRRAALAVVTDAAEFRPPPVALIIGGYFGRGLSGRNGRRCRSNAKGSHRSALRPRSKAIIVCVARMRCLGRRLSRALLARECRPMRPRCLRTDAVADCLETTCRCRRRSNALDRLRGGLDAADCARGAAGTRTVCFVSSSTGSGF